jgi:phage shock protein A
LIQQASKKELLATANQSCEVDMTTHLIDEVNNQNTILQHKIDLKDQELANMETLVASLKKRISKLEKQKNELDV